MTRPGTRFALCFALALLPAGCVSDASGGSGPNDASAADTVEDLPACGACNDPCALIDCQAGYRCVAGTCVDTGDLCSDVECSGRGTCNQSGGSAACVCDGGYQAQGLQCVPIDTPCGDCSGVGECVADACDCETGYTGVFCESCADGYERQSSACVFTVDPCDDTNCGDSACVGGECVDFDLIATPSFETAGLIVATHGNLDVNSITLTYAAMEGAPIDGHPFVQYDLNNWATTLFGLNPATAYEVVVTLTTDVGDIIVSDMVTTRQVFAIPAPVDVVNVSDTVGLEAALGSAQPGTEIRLAAGTYGPVSIFGLHGTPTAPIVIRAADAEDQPVIDAAGASRALDVEFSSYLVFDNLEVTGAADDDEGIGVYLRSDAHVVVQNCEIHDNGHWNLYVSKSHLFDGAGGGYSGGYHLIQNNEIYELDSGDCAGASNSACPDQTYYGIQLDNNPGAANVIRRNTVSGHVDNIGPCGDESVARELGTDVEHVLAMTRDNPPETIDDAAPGHITNHDVEVYENRMSGARDDNFETDGVCVNARFYDNVIENAQNALTIAPVMPGPLFFVRNVITDDWGEAAVKMNTGGNSNVPTRNVFFYHNTFVRSTEGTMLNLWYAVEGDHNVPIENIVFRNNIFLNDAGGRLIDANNRGQQHPDFDYNLWFTRSVDGTLFQWWSGDDTVSFDSFESFQSSTSQEANGVYADPRLDEGFRPQAGSNAVVDRGTVIPGVSLADDGVPDLGAFEAP